MAGQLSKYSFINAKLRARISKILTDETFLQLAKAPALEEALALLRDTPFADLEQIYSQTGDIKQAELQLLKDEIELYRNLKQYLHKTSIDIIEALLYRFEIENLKNAIRLYFDRKIRKRSIDQAAHYIIYEPIIHNIPIDIIINADDFDEIAGVCHQTPYPPIIKKYSHTVEAKGSLFRMEVALDHFYFENLHNCVSSLEKKDRQTASALIGIQIDLQNIDWIIRLKNFYQLPLDAVLAIIVPGGLNLKKEMIQKLYDAQNVEYTLQTIIKTKYPGLATLVSSQPADSSSKLQILKQMLAEIQSQQIQKILAGYPFNIGIIISYFILKQQELSKIRMILNAKQYGIQTQRIESMI